MYISGLSTSRFVSSTYNYYSILYNYTYSNTNNIVSESTQIIVLISLVKIHK